MLHSPPKGAIVPHHLVRVKRPGRALALALSVLLALSACSSSGSKSPSSNSGSPSASSDSAGSASLSALEAKVAQLEKVPTHIAQTTPLKSKPTPGKEVIFMSCNIECPIEGNAVKAAAAVVGWKFRQIIYNIEDPSTMVSGLKQALQYHPSVVIAGAIPYVTWQSVIPAYKAAGVPLVTFAAGAPVKFPVVTAIADFPQYRQYGADLADWFIADSKGKGHAFITGSTDAAALAAAVDGFQAEVKAKCPGCTTEYDNLSLQDINSGAAIPAVVSAVQRDPSIDYAITPNGSFFTGLASQLASVGLSKKVKIAGIYGTSADLANLKAGTEAAWLNYSVTQIGWASMDAALRYSEGMAMDPDESDVPIQLLVPGGDFKVANSTDVPTNYAAQYEALWKAS